MTIVHVQHPVNARFALRKGGRVRSVVTTGSVPVEIAHVDPRDVEVVHEDPYELVSYALHDGALWHRPMMRPGEPLPADKVIRWMSDANLPRFGTLVHRIEAHFARTPLLWLFQARGDGCKVRSGDGELPSRCVRLADDEGDAARAVAAHLGDNVRICGDGLLVRSPGPLVAFPHGSHRGGRAELVHFPSGMPLSLTAVGFHEARSLWALWGGDYDPYPVPMPEIPAWLGAIGKEACGGLDVDVLAGLAVVALDEPLDLYARAVRVPDKRDAIRRLRSRLDAFVDPVAMGLLGGDAAEEALELCAEILGGLAGRGAVDLRADRSVLRSTQEESLVRMHVVRGDLLHRARERRQPDGADVEALSGLRF